MSTISSPSSVLMAVSTISWWRSRSFTSSTNVSMRLAPRTFRSLPTSSSFSAERATRKNSTPSLAKHLAASWAITEVAPTINILILLHPLHLHQLFRKTHTPPETGGEVWINVPGKLPPFREKRLEVLGAHARIFRRVNSSSALAHNCVQVIKQLQGLLAVVSKIQGQRYPWSWERQQAR